MISIKWIVSIFGLVCGIELLVAVVVGGIGLGALVGLEGIFVAVIGTVGVALFGRHLRNQLRSHHRS